MTQRIIYATLLLIGIVFGASWYLEHRPAPLTVDQAVAHEQTAVATLAAAKVETVFVAQKAVAAAARVEYRMLGGTPAQHNAAWEYQARVKADTVILLDSLALASADSTITAHKAVQTALREELRLALIPKPPPRLSKVLAGLYDPQTRNMMASASVGLRIVGDFSLNLVAFQPVTTPGSPRVFVGASYRL